MAFIKNVSIDNVAVAAPQGYDFEKIKNSYFTSNASNKDISLSLLVRKDSYFVLSNGKFSDDQQIEETNNADLVKITATVADTPKLRAFLRGLGNAIEVLEPPLLRKYFKSLALDLLAKYEKEHTANQ